MRQTFLKTFAYIETVVSNSDESDADRYHVCCAVAEVAAGVVPSRDAVAASAIGACQTHGRVVAA